MKNLWRHFIYTLWEDEAAVKRWLWGIFAFLATLASLVLPNGVAEAMLWSRREWAFRIVSALIAQCVAMVNPASKGVPDYHAKPGVEQ